MRESTKRERHTRNYRTKTCSPDGLVTASPDGPTRDTLDGPVGTFWEKCCLNLISEPSICNGQCTHRTVRRVHCALGLFLISLKIALSTSSDVLIGGYGECICALRSFLNHFTDALSTLSGVHRTVLWETHQMVQCAQMSFAKTDLSLQFKWTHQTV